MVTVHWNLDYWITVILYLGDTNIDRVIKDLDKAKIEYTIVMGDIKQTFKIRASVKTAGKIYRIITKDDKTNFFNPKQNGIQINKRSTTKV